jgi:hypothetical protein
MRWPLGVIVTVADDDRQWRMPTPRKKPRPAQDEWGMFDPGQCGLGAILEKLKRSGGR